MSKNLGRSDFGGIDGKLTYQGALKIEGDLVIEGSLGWIKFSSSIVATGSIFS